MSALGPPSPRLEAARAYRSLGWCCVPWPAGVKGTAAPGWDRQRLDGEALEQAFAGPGNLGVILGSASGDLVDVDLDCPEALALADDLLPETWTFGSSAPRTHRLYVAQGATTARHADEHRETLVELRAGSGGAQQTILPPSVHPSGSVYAWDPGDADGTEAPLVVPADELEQRVARLAAASLVARYATLDAARGWLQGGRRPALPGHAEAALRGILGVEAPQRVSNTRAVGLASGELLEAVAAFNRDHPLDLPRSGGACPICGHQGCWGALPEHPGRWACFSTGHPPGAGVAGASCVTGDALDIEAHLARRTRVELLRRQGYLGARR